GKPYFTRACTRTTRNHNSQLRLNPRNALTGSNTISLSKLSTPSTATPRIRKGKSKSHTNGYKTNARRASGQQTISRMHHKRKVSMFLIYVEGCGGVPREALSRQVAYI